MIDFMSRHACNIVTMPARAVLEKKKKFGFKAAFIMPLQENQIRLSKKKIEKNHSVHRLKLLTVTTETDPSGMVPASTIPFPNVQALGQCAPANISLNFSKESKKDYVAAGVNSSSKRETAYTEEEACFFVVITGKVSKHACYPSIISTRAN